MTEGARKGGMRESTFYFNPCTRLGCALRKFDRKRFQQGIAPKKPWRNQVSRPEIDASQEKFQGVYQGLFVAQPRQDWLTGLFPDPE